MKKTLTALCLAAACALWALPAAAEGEPVAELSIQGAQQATAGDTVDYTITFTGEQPLSGLDYTLTMADGFSVVGLEPVDAVASELSCNTEGKSFIFIYLDNDLATPLQSGQTLCTLKVKAATPCTDQTPFTVEKLHAAAILGGDVVAMDATMNDGPAITVSASGGTNAPAGDATQPGTAAAPGTTSAADGAATDATSQAAPGTATQPAGEEKPFTMMSGVEVTQEQMLNNDPEAMKAIEEAEAAALPEPAADAAPDTAAAQADKPLNLPVLIVALVACAAVLAAAAFALLRHRKKQ